MNQPPFVSVIIKTYNEQAGIAETLSRIRKQLYAQRIPHEMIVADSLSTDETQAIALAHGAKVVSLTQGADRCCGVGHQLGSLYAQGELLLLMDGDMQLAAGFIEQGIAFLQQHADYAGVAGKVEMDDAVSYEFQSRKQRLHDIYPLGDCSHLGGGGLYRKSAIDPLGYLTHRHLHAYEEAELGMRLKLAGYRLHRLDTPYIFHTSYALSTFQLLRYRWRGGYTFAAGELLKSAWGKPHFIDAVIAVRNEAIFGGYLLGLMLALCVSGMLGNSMVFGGAMLPLVTFFCLKAIKNRSLRGAAHSVINLTVYSVGLMRGLFLPLNDPYTAPAHHVVGGCEVPERIRRTGMQNTEHETRLSAGSGQ